MKKILSILFLCFTSIANAQTTVELQAAKDNTLIEDPSGSVSYGAGPHFFAGSALGSIRRGLIAIDLSAIPSGATILDATLTLEMDRTIAGREDVSLHRLLADWGEAGSTGGGGGGGGGTGAPAEPGDATWIHTFFDTDFWSAAGGDFETTASATTPVNAPGSYTWSEPGMVEDLQAWVDDPSSHFGWAVVGNEASSVTAKRFQSREGAVPPVLSVTYTLQIVAIPTLGEAALVIVALLLAMAAIRRLRYA